MYKCAIFVLALILGVSCGENREAASLEEKIVVDKVKEKDVDNIIEKTLAETAVADEESKGAIPELAKIVEVEAVNRKDEVNKNVATIVPEAKPLNNEQVAKGVTIEPIAKVEDDVKESVEKVVKAEVVKPVQQFFSHNIFDDLLRKYVSASGKVNYRGFKNESNQLYAYLTLLKSNPPKSSWSKSKTMAYWINVYNAYTIKTIVEHYPVKSIMDIKGGKVWDVPMVKVGNTMLSLSQVENDKLRRDFKDARIHFAVVCAAKSCPVLLNRAWEANTLNADLNRQTKKFLASTENKISSKKLELSQIFNWYKEDYGDIVEFVNKYSAVEVSKKTKVSYLEYNWSLNE